jgi:hypothetical protein
MVAVTQITNPSNVAVQTNQLFNGSVPREGPKSVPLTITFTGAQTILVDLQQQSQLARISGVQTVWIDNHANAFPITIASEGTQQVVECPPNAQGYFPILVTSNLKFDVTSGHAGTIEIQLINFAIAAAVWSVNAIAVPSYPFLFDANGNLKVTNHNAEGVTVTNYSSTITAGGTAQFAIPANANRKQYRLMNINLSTDPGASETIWYRDDGGVAVIGGAGSWPLVGASTGAGGFAQGQSTAAISVIAATTGHKFTAVSDVGL